MYPPNTTKPEQPSQWPEWHEPFPEPQTIPTGWDLSALPSELSASEADSEDEA